MLWQDRTNVFIFSHQSIKSHCLLTTLCCLSKLNSFQYPILMKGHWSQHHSRSFVVFHFNWFITLSLRISGLESAPFYRCEINVSGRSWLWHRDTLTWLLPSCLPAKVGHDDDDSDLRVPAEINARRERSRAQTAVLWSPVTAATLQRMLILPGRT